MAAGANQGERLGNLGNVSGDARFNHFLQISSRQTIYHLPGGRVVYAATSP